MYGPRFFPPDAADSEDIHQAGNTIASEDTREDNRPFGAGSHLLHSS